MKVLLHACCGPCAAYPTGALRAEGMDLRLYFFNPNVHPYREFQRRAEAIKEFARQTKTPLIADERYNLDEWLRDVVFRESRRCRLCYHKRLAAAALVARKGKFDAFSTTLLYSKQQNHEAIREMAGAVAEEVGVPFLYRDFREGWSEGIEESKRMGLYRQEYCGCVYSERDRFLGAPKPGGGPGEGPLEGLS